MDTTGKLKPRGNGIAGAADLSIGENRCPVMDTQIHFQLDTPDQPLFRHSGLDHHPWDEAVESIREIRYQPFNIQHCILIFCMIYVVWVLILMC